jgi:hypothetical protein
LRVLVETAYRSSCIVVVAVVVVAAAAAVVAADAVVRLSVKLACFDRF